MVCGFLGSLSDVSLLPLVLRALSCNKHLLFQPFHFPEDGADAKINVIWY